jgi:bacterioferritin
MTSKNKIVDALNALLANELSAMDQYFIHAKMYEDWGITKLFARINHEFDDEKGHASLLIERILFLGGTPDLSNRDGINVGTTVPEMLQSDLNIEYAVGALLKQTIALCEKEKDYVSRDILMTLLDDTERDHAHWLEQQLKLISLLGLENYIQSQL